MSSLIYHPVSSISKKETTIWADLRGELFACAIKAGEVGEMLKIVDACAEKEGVTEQYAMALEAVA